MEQIPNIPFEHMNGYHRHFAIKNLCSTEPIVCAVNALGRDTEESLQLMVLYLAKALKETQGQFTRYMANSTRPITGA